MEKVNKSFAATIYPGNMQNAIPKCTQIAKSMYIERLVARNAAAFFNLEQQKMDMEKVLEGCTFQAFMIVGAYGPVVQVFAGADYVHQEATAKDHIATWHNNGHEANVKMTAMKD